MYRHAKLWKSEHSTGLKHAFMPLHFVHGEAAQFDWSTEYAWIGGSRKLVKLAHMKLCSSRAFWLSAYPGESHEMLFDAHHKAFAALGGVPKRIIYDNMKTAVDKVLSGKRRLVNARFDVMCSHYLFEPDFCNVASGCSMRIVEKNVRDTRARIWSTVLDRMWVSWDELNDWLGEQCRAQWHTLKHPTWSNFTLAEVLEQERGSLMPTPKTFDGYVEIITKASSTGLVRLNNNHYSVPIDLAGKVVSLHIYPHRLTVVHEQLECAMHPRTHATRQTIYNWQHYIPLIAQKPGALRNGAPLLDMPNALKRLQASLLKHEGGDRLMADLLACVPVHGLESVLVAVELAFDAGLPSVEHVMNLMSRLKPEPLGATIVSSLVQAAPSQANVERYDAFLLGEPS